MSKEAVYLAELSRRTEWVDYLLEESGLPGPRGNIELARAVAKLGHQELFDGFLTLGPVEAPVNSPKEFLVFCGTLGLGRLESEGKIDGLTRLKRLSADPRWRVREAVAMALQMIGRADFDRLVSTARTWSEGNPLERRAAIAGICEPDLLSDASRASTAIEILASVTESLCREADRKHPDARTLRQALGYCWSVAVAADPGPGFDRFEQLVESNDPDIRWIVRQNLRKKRLAGRHSERVEQLQHRMK